MDAGSVMSSWSAPSVRTRTRNAVVLRLDVDVGRPVAHGLLEDEVDDLDDRRVLVDLDHRRLRSVSACCRRRSSARCLEVAQRVVDVGVRAVDSARAPTAISSSAATTSATGASSASIRRVSSASHEWIGARDVHALAFDRERDRPQLVRDRGREPADDLGVELVAGRGRRSTVRAARRAPSRCRGR